MTWSRTRKLVQIVSLAAFVALTVSSVGLFGWNWLPDNVFSRLDPLVGLAAIVASKAWISFWAAALITVAATVVFGRGWCGWICPVGTLLDLLAGRKRKPAQRMSRRWRVGKYVTLTVVMGAAVLGSLAPMILDPVTILTRPLQELARPFAGTDAVGQAVGADIGRGGLHAVALLSLIPLALVLALNLIERRAWCRTLCPLGGMLGLISRLPGVRRTVDAESCISCGRCSAVCPTDAINRKAAGWSSSPAECTDCMLCVDACEQKANGFALTPHSMHVGLPTYREDRRDALIAAGAVGLSVGAAMLPVATASAEQYILRPPSTDDKRLAELCVRCGACYGACPTGVLRPSVSFVSEAGPWTPMLDARPPHCTMNCNRCARPCPTDAIHTPTPDEAAVLGLGKVATVNRTQCRAWVRNHDCMLCRQRCPIAGALVGQDRPRDFDAIHASEPQVQVPAINSDLCVGCNQCMGACPMMPPAVGVDLPPFDGRMLQGMPGGDSGGGGMPGGDSGGGMPGSSY
jgi:polyferredoxin